MHFFSAASELQNVAGCLIKCSGMRRKKGDKMGERGRDLEIGGSCSVRGETNRGSDISCEAVWLLAAASFCGAEMDDGNNPFSVLVTYSPEGGAVLQFLHSVCRPGNREKLRYSQAELSPAIKSAEAYFASVSGVANGMQELYS